MCGIVAVVGKEKSIEFQVFHTHRHRSSWKLAYLHYTLRTINGPKLAAQILDFEKLWSKQICFVFVLFSRTSTALRAGCGFSPSALRLETRESTAMRPCAWPCRMDRNRYGKTRARAPAKHPVFTTAPHPFAARSTPCVRRDTQARRRARASSAHPPSFR